MPGKPDNPINFWQELKRRKVVRVIIVYAAASFVVLELTDIVAPSLGLPDWTLNFIIILLCVGFIITVIFSWIYDVTPEGIEKTKPVNETAEEEPVKPSGINAWKIATIISVVFIVGLIIVHTVGERRLVEDPIELEKSIAVLPFINDSPDEENGYFINGIMDELIINLQSIKDLRVPGRTSVEQFRNNPKSIPEIARELGVNYIVEASGQKYGNEFTLRVQLLEGATGMHLWGKPIRKDIESVEDIISIQSSMAKSIAEELHAVITPEEKQLIEKTPTTNLTAYDFYQRGREEHVKYWLDNDNREALERAEDLYRNALEYDSAFALAYTGLAWVYRNKHYWETFLTENFLDSVLILADIALSFDNQLAEAYVIRGDYYRANNKYEQAINEYDKAIKYNPNHWEPYWRKGWLYFHDDLVKEIDNFQKAASLHSGGPFVPELYRDIGIAYTHAGFKEKAIYYVKEALKLDDDSAAYYSSLAEIEGLYINLEKAIEFWEKAYAIDSTDYWVIGLLGLDHMYLGHYKESLEYYIKYEKRRKALGRLVGRAHLSRIGYVYWINGFKEEAEYYFNRGLERHNQLIELDRDSPQGFGTFYNLAAIYAFQGDKDKAYEYLKLYNQRPRMSLWIIREIKNNPLFDNIRNEPEFQQIVKDLEVKYQAEHERVRKWLEEQGML